MSFLGMGTMEILIILLVAFIFLGPERMVDAARTLGKWTGELRRMGSTVQAEMDDLANVGAPLSSRYDPARNGKGADTTVQPLDQDHPTDESDPAGSDAPPANTPVTFSAASADTDQPPSDKSQSVRREESA